MVQLHVAGCANLEAYFPPEMWHPGHSEQWLPLSSFFELACQAWRFQSRRGSSTWGIWWWKVQHFILLMWSGRLKKRIMRVLSLQVPVGRECLGRIINVLGEPVDEVGPISESPKPLISQSQSSIFFNQYCFTERIWKLSYITEFVTMHLCPMKCQRDRISDVSLWESDNNAQIWLRHKTLRTRCRTAAMLYSRFDYNWELKRFTGEKNTDKACYRLQDAKHWSSYYCLSSNEHQRPRI